MRKSKGRIAGLFLKAEKEELSSCLKEGVTWKKNEDRKRKQWRRFRSSIPRMRNERSWGSSPVRSWKEKI